MLLKLSSKGQLVLPKSIREQLRLKNGDQFQARVVKGTIVLEPVTLGAIDRLHGILAGTDALQEFEADHRWEIEHDQKHSA